MIAHEVTAEGLGDVRGLDLELGSRLVGAVVTRVRGDEDALHPVHDDLVGGRVGALADPDDALVGAPLPQLGVRIGLHLHGLVQDEGVVGHGHGLEVGLRVGAL